MMLRRPRHGRTTIGLRLAVLGALSVLVLAAAATWSAWTIHSRDRAVAAITHVYAPAQAASSDLLAAYLDQETGERGFVITGEERFLAPWASGREAEARAAGTLRDLLAHDPGLISGLDRVERAAEAWRILAAEPEIAAARRSPEQARALVAMGAGKAAFDTLRANFADFRSAFQARRAVADTRRQDTSTLLLHTMWGLLGLAVVLALTIVLIVWRSVQRPILALRNSVRAIAGGALDQAIESEGPREIAELGDDIEAMRRRVHTEVVLVEAISNALAEANTALGDANHALEDANRTLERSNADLTQFAYVTSHDLSEPLRVIGGFAQLLREDCEGRLGEEADEYLRFITGGVERMRVLIQGLLEYSRVGRADREIEPVALDAVVADAVHDLSALVTDTHAIVRREPLGTVMGDPLLLRRLVQNLVANAIKFHREGVVPEVTISAQHEGERLIVSVADNGIGIEPAYRERVFGMFQRLHAREAYDGSGIGLAVCRKIVEAHGGTIAAEANEPHGTIFRFDLGENMTCRLAPVVAPPVPVPAPVPVPVQGRRPDLAQAA